MSSRRVLVYSMMLHPVVYVMNTGIVFYGIKCFIARCSRWSKDWSNWLSVLLGMRRYCEL